MLRLVTDPLLDPLVDRDYEQGGRLGIALDEILLLDSRTNQGDNHVVEPLPVAPELIEQVGLTLSGPLDFHGITGSRANLIGVKPDETVQLEARRTGRITTLLMKSSGARFKSNAICNISSLPRNQ